MGNPSTTSPIVDHTTNNPKDVHSTSSNRNNKGKRNSYHNNNNNNAINSTSTSTTTTSSSTTTTSSSTYQTASLSNSSAIPPHNLNEALPTTSSTTTSRTSNSNDLIRSDIPRMVQPPAVMMHRMNEDENHPLRYMYRATPPTVNPEIRMKVTQPLTNPIPPPPPHTTATAAAAATQGYPQNMATVPPPGVGVVHPRMYHQRFPMGPAGLYGAPVYIPAPAGYRPRMMSGQNNAAVAAAANNGMMRSSNFFDGISLPPPPPPHATTAMHTAMADVPPQPPSKNEAVNNEFASLLKNVLGTAGPAAAATAAPNTTTASTTTITSSNAKTTESSRVVIAQSTATTTATAKRSSVTGTPIVVESKSPVSEVSLAFKDLMRGVLDGSSDKEIKVKPVVDAAAATNKSTTTTEKSATSTTTPRSSVVAAASVNETSIEFSNILKNVAHGESSPPVVTCEFGLEIDGIKTYSIADMLEIGSKAVYDVQKMVSTLSKFRIASSHSKSPSMKNEKLWKTIAEKRKLGLVGDKEVFNHSLLQILNKVTAINFHQNWASFRSLKFTSTDLVKLYANLLFDKVIGEHSWSYVYSELARISINSFNQLYPNETYAEVFSSTLMDGIKAGLTRDYAEEEAIRELKKSTSKDVETIDKIIAETAERETTYRKNHFGVVLFVANLYYDGVIKQATFDEILEQLRKENDSLGVELYVSMLENIAVKYVEGGAKTITLLCKFIDQLNDYVKAHTKELSSRARFTMMDLFKYKQDKFKNLPPKKKVPKPNEQPQSSSGGGVHRTSVIVTSNSSSAYGLDSHRRTSAANGGDSFSRMDNNNNRSNNNNNNRFNSFGGRGAGRDSRNSNNNKMDISDNRRPNPDVFHNSNRVTGGGSNATNKAYNKSRGMGAGATISHSQRYARMVGSGANVSLDVDNTTIPVSASSLTSRTTYDSTTKPISLLKHKTDSPPKAAVTMATTKADMASTNLNTTKSNAGITRSVSSNVYVPSSGGRMNDNEAPKRLQSQETTSSFERDDAKDNEIKNLEETAQTLISNFQLHETNVSRFIIELSGYSLSDHMGILIREAFIYYKSGISHGHYAFGMLLSEMMGRYPELIAVVKENLAAQLVELPLNALDEPVLWDYFFLTVLPMCSNKRITLDELHELLANTPDVTDADATIVNMLIFGEKRLAKYDVTKLVAKQTDTKFWKRLVSKSTTTTTSSHTTDDIVQTISKKLPLVTAWKSGHFLHWVDILLDVNYDATYLIKSFTSCYNTPDEGLKDVAKCLYLYSAIGDKFTNDLITIFNKRNKQFMDQLFGVNSSQRLLCYLAEIFAVFKFTPNGAIVDIGVPLYKNDHVDKEWLNSWMKQEDKPYDSAKIDSDIYKIIKSKSA